MQLELVFGDSFQEILNDANDAMVDLVMLANAMLQDGKSLDEITSAIEQELKPVADELGLTFKVRTFIFPTLITKRGE